MMFFTERKIHIELQRPHIAKSTVNKTNKPRNIALFEYKIQNTGISIKVKISSFWLQKWGHGPVGQGRKHRDKLTHF